MKDHKPAAGQHDVPAATIAYEEHWGTWSVNRGYYGVSDSDDRNTTRWTIEWVKPNTRAAARVIAARQADIDAIVIAHAHPDRNGNRRARLAMTPNADGTITITEYDFQRFTAVLRHKDRAANNGDRR